MNKQTALTIFSIAGVTASVVVTAVMAPKAHEAIKAKKLEISKTHPGYEDTEKDRHGFPKKILTADKLELVKTAAPYYIPTALLCTLTIGTIILNHRVNSKALLGLSATTSYLVANRDKFKKVADKPEVKKIVGKLYPEKKEFKHQTIEETGNGDLLCFEGYSGRIFRSSKEAVDEAIRKLDDMFLEEKYCCFNDFYRFLGIEQTHFGHQYGWVNAEDWYENLPLDFQPFILPADAEGNEFGEDVYMIDLFTYPMECWQEV